MNKNNSQLRGHSLNLNKLHTNKSIKLRSFAMKFQFGIAYHSGDFRRVGHVFSSSSKLDFF